MMKQWIPGLILVLGFAGNLSFAAAAVETPLTTLSAVHALSNTEAGRKLPAAFEATVTYFRGYEKTLFVQDGETSIYVNATTDLKLVPGDRILVRGVTEGSFRPIVVSHDLTLLRQGSLPPPVRASFSKMIRAELDCRYVVVNGTVLSANLSLSSGRSVIEMVVRAEGGNVAVIMDGGDPHPLKDLLDAEVEVAGVVSGRFDGKMQQTGILIHATSMENVNILHRAPTDAWSLPATPMDEVLREADVEDHTRRVHVQGTLTYYQPASMAVLQDGERSIRVLTPQIDRLRVGDRAEAVGIP